MTSYYKVLALSDLYFQSYLLGSILQSNLTSTLTVTVVGFGRHKNGTLQS